MSETQGSALRCWCDANGRTFTWVMHETRLAWRTVMRAAKGRKVSVETAEKLSALTGLPRAAFSLEDAEARVA